MSTLTQRYIRYNDMQACTTAFIDARTPGSDKKENFCLIGDGVAENPEQVVHIQIPHGFNVGAARQPKGCKNSHHSHDTEEVFMIFSGEWKFTWGEEGQDGQVVLSQGDTISLPAHMFRGFEYVGEGKGFMFSILGLNEAGSAGKVLWAPYVFDQAKEHGLVLLEDGRLIDVAAGNLIPKDAQIMPKTSQEQVDALTVFTMEEMQKYLALQGQLNTFNSGGLSKISGVEEYAIIGPENAHESIGAGQMAWSHNFHLRRMRINSGCGIENHIRKEEEVLIIQSGELQVFCGDEFVSMRAGDLITLSVDMQRRFYNPGNDVVDVWVIRRGNAPQAAQFI